jgi:hypothetical protein
MDIDPDLARTLGFPKLKYAYVERERRWLCARLPDVDVVSADAITDLYIDGSRLRLREARPFALREVTDDPRYAGGWLAAHGLPPADDGL